MSPRIARFDWDDGNQAHVARHDVSVKDVQDAILDPFCLLESSGVRQGELRYKVTGETSEGRIIVVVFQIRRGAIRPITSFTAPLNNKSSYLTRRQNVSKTSIP
jgi:uncharacterized DUF497 family protein